MVRALFEDLYKAGRLWSSISFISCARACTVASEVSTEAQFFADCKLHIRTRLLASAFSNFWKPFTTLSNLLVTALDMECLKELRIDNFVGVESHVNLL